MVKQYLHPVDPPDYHFPAIDDRVSFYYQLKAAYRSIYKAQYMDSQVEKSFENMYLFASCILKAYQLRDEGEIITNPVVKKNYGC